MDVFALVGMVLTYILTELIKKNPKMKEQAPLVVTVISTLLGAIQAALAAATANAMLQVADTTSVAVAQSGGFFENVFKYAGDNLLGGIGLHVGIRKFAVDWLWGSVIKKLL